jgi:hypothetical protein
MVAKALRPGPLLKVFLIAPGVFAVFVEPGDGADASIAAALVQPHRTRVAVPDFEKDTAAAAMPSGLFGGVDEKVPNTLSARPVRHSDGIKTRPVAVAAKECDRTSDHLAAVFGDEDDRRVAGDVAAILRARHPIRRKSVVLQFHQRVQIGRAGAADVCLRGHGRTSRI